MKVLVIEDSNDDAFLVERLIRRACLDMELTAIERARDTEEAIKMLIANDRDYGLITLDGNLHHASSIRILDELEFTYKLKDRYFGKIIGISDDEAFLHNCHARDILVFHKNSMIADKDSRDAMFKPLVKKIIKAHYA